MSLPSIPSQFPQPQLKGNINWKAVIFWAVILGLAFAAVWWFYREPIMAWISTPKLPDINLAGFWQGIMDYINKNPIATLAAAASICTAGVTLISKIRADNAKNAVIEQAAKQQAQVEALANQQIIQQQNLANSYKVQLEQALKNNNVDALSEAQRLVTEKEVQVKTLQQALDQANDKLTSIPYREVVKHK